MPAKEQTAVCYPRRVQAHSCDFALKLLAGLIGLFIALPLAGAEQEFAITGSVIAGGGGSSTGSGFFVEGTIAQPAAGTLPGGSFDLDAGFWNRAVVVPSTGGAPTLFIQQAGASVIVSWSPATPGFTLEQTDSLSTPSWSAGPAGNPTPPIAASGFAKFYRLRRP